ncbi:MAG: hypothetical protein JST16_18295 [Bdellovibrionales bacterium]|nr:hypothetical protein [Bdellovibrionales bacterium]
MKVSEFTKNNPIIEETHRKLESHLKHLEQQRMVRAFESCGICGGEVKFDHRTDWLQNQVHEKGHCPTCLQETPTRVYSLS